jgi:hypothetical protein
LLPSIIMPGGRPTVLTPEVKRKIADCFLVAFTDEQTAQLCGISAKSIQRMRRGELCPEIKTWEMARELAYRMKIWNAKGFWQGAAWFLERKYPTQFAKPEVQLQINTTNQTVNNTLIITAEAAHSNAERVKPLDVKIEKLLKDKRPGHNGNGAKSSSPEAKK